MSSFKQLLFALLITSNIDFNYSYGDNNIKSIMKLSPTSKPLRILSCPILSSSSSPSLLKLINIKPPKVNKNIINSLLDNIKNKIKNILNFFGFYYICIQMILLFINN